MYGLIKHIKYCIGYSDKAPSCESCKWFDSDGDDRYNFNSPDSCTRNPNISFPTTKSSVCDEWSL